MRIESNANFSVTLSKQGTHYHLLYCQHLNKSSSSAFRPALNLWLLLVCKNIVTKAILFFFGCSEVNSTWLITSELANQRARKVLLTCVVNTSTNKNYYQASVIMTMNHFLKLITNYSLAKMWHACFLSTIKIPSVDFLSGVNIIQQARDSLLLQLFGLVWLEESLFSKCNFWVLSAQ